MRLSISCIIQKIYLQNIQTFTKNSMKDNRNFPYRKRLNTQVLTKTQLALQAIKRYDMEQSRVNLYVNNKFDDKNMLNEMDNDYAKFTPHKRVQLERTYKINLFTYSQQFYYLQMINYVFPMRIVVRNVRNTGVMYIGYDQQYPGLYKKNKLSIFDNQSPQKQKNYDFKTAISKQMLITLKNKGNKTIKNVYFTFIAGESLLMFDFKIEFLGFVRDERIMSEIKLRSIGKLNLEGKKEKDQGIPPLKRQNTQPNHNSKNFTRSKVEKAQKFNKNNLIKLQQFHVFQQDGMPRHFSKHILSPTKLDSPTKHPSRLLLQKLNKTKTKSMAIFRNTNKGLQSIKNERSEIDIKIQQNKRNKQMIQLFKVKDKELRQLSSKGKRLIEDYQKSYHEDNIKRRRLNQNIVTMIFALKYVSKTSRICSEIIRKKSMRFKIDFLCIKFIKRLKKAHQKTCQILPYKYKRYMVQGSSLIGLQCKILQKQVQAKSSKIIADTLMLLLPSLQVNKCFSMANIYRNSIKLIQRTWKTKYHGRIYSLLYFIDNHVQRMMREYPHLKIFLDVFYKSGAIRQICLAYIKDQSEKYRFIYDAYKKKLQEIEEMMNMNSIISLQKSQNKSSKLIIPKKPLKPMHRFYRNLDILKSMVRTWFQIEYKKYMKKSGIVRKL